MNGDGRATGPFASRKRLLLAAYLDYLLFGAPWTLGLYLLGVRESLTLWKLLAFGLLEALLFSSVHWSPGQGLLGIRRHVSEDAPIHSEGHHTSRVYFVDPYAANRETWLTMLFSVYLILEGSKELVRWTMWTPPPPFFGSRVSVSVFPMVAVLSGLVHIAGGGLLLRTQRLGAWIILTLTAVQFVSVIMSWDHWDSYAAEQVLKRREYQGLPVRPGEVEFMQQRVPEALIGVLALQLAAALYAALRFSDRAPS